jgi:hypothetical protein
VRSEKVRGERKARVGLTQSHVSESVEGRL